MLSSIIVISLKEYKIHFTQRKYNLNYGNLTIEDIFQNENRKKILREILDQPGIHHNELLRRCDIQKGQLQWHLSVLKRYGIIKSKKFNQYKLFFPIKKFFKNESSLEDLIKSQTTLEILDIIANEPGIIMSEISNKLNLAKSTIKYHLDKLKQKDIIEISQKGREKRLKLKNFN
ncbi:MAG: winged helix-turn-helix transcriptional regulator [Candidatus Lokiarchaeota archaeon]